jgi:hypothetical protein
MEQKPILMIKWSHAYETNHCGCDKTAQALTDKQNDIFIRIDLSL